MRSLAIASLWLMSAVAPALGNSPPDSPILLLPAEGETAIPPSVPLDVAVSDANDDPLTVTFFGRSRAPSPGFFTVVVLPDTQMYSQDSPGTYIDQVLWILGTRSSLHTAFVTHVGDIVNGPKQDWQWQNADAAMSLLDWYIPYGVLPGNHDMERNGSTPAYDDYFPASRYSSYPWYGGSYRNNRNSYQLISAEGIDLLFLHLEVDAPDAVLDWAEQVLESHPGRTAILTTHSYMSATGQRTQTPWHQPGGNSGQQIWEKLVSRHCNVALVLSGHLNGEGHRVSTNECGEAVHEVMQNYQFRKNGGDGWLRYYTFRPSQDRVDAVTYSPTLDAYETDADSMFSMTLRMGFRRLGERRAVTSGGPAMTTWTGVPPHSQLEWYVGLHDGTAWTMGPRWSFSSGPCVATAASDTQCNGIDDDCDGLIDEDHMLAQSSCGVGACTGRKGWKICLNEGRERDTCSPYLGATPEICDGLDNDCDGVVDNLPVPWEPQTLRVQTDDRIVWNLLIDADGYDVVRGDLRALREAGYSTSECLASGTTSGSLQDPQEPATGEGLWYLVRGRNCGGPSAWEAAGGGFHGPRDAIPACPSQP